SLLGSQGLTNTPSRVAAYSGRERQDVAKGPHWMETIPCSAGSSRLAKFIASRCVHRPRVRQRSAEWKEVDLRLPPLVPPTRRLRMLLDCRGELCPGSVLRSVDSGIGVQPI